MRWYRWMLAKQSKNVSWSSAGKEISPSTSSAPWAAWPNRRSIISSAVGTAAWRSQQSKSSVTAWICRSRISSIPNCSGAWNKKLSRFHLNAKTARRGSVVLFCRAEVVSAWKLTGTGIYALYSSFPICSMKTSNPNPMPTGFKFRFLQYGRAAHNKIPHQSWKALAKLKPKYSIIARILNIENV